MSNFWRGVVLAVAILVIGAVTVVLGIMFFEQKFVDDTTQVDIHYGWHHHWIREMRDVVKVLESVKDQTTADAAAHAVHIRGLSVKSMYERQIRLPELTKLQKRLLPNDCGATQQRLHKQITNLLQKAQAFHDGQSQFSKSLDELREALAKIQTSPQR